jgi:high affinity Mn2+ porin
MNWAAWTAGAWDYAADTRGYTYGFVIERFDGDWAARFAGAAEPLVANGEQLDKDLLHAYSLTAEYERGYTLSDRQGTARLLVFYNRADMGNYDEAIAQAEETGEAPDIVATRRVGRAKWGFIVNADLSLGGPWGAFFRGSWNDGANESWAYAEIERSASTGVLRKGPFSGRPNDEAGLALIVNGLGASHREYLALGGYGFMIGDGRLNYGLETIAEIFYQAAVIEHLWFAADYQFVANPAYNRDRGPINVLGARLHVEF